MCSPTPLFSASKVTDDDARFHLSVFPQNLAQVVDTGELNTKDCTFVVVSRDQIYSNVSKYVAEHGKERRSFGISRSFKARVDLEDTYFLYGSMGRRGGTKSIKGKKRPDKTTQLSMGKGLHELEFENKPIWVLNQIVGDVVGSNRGASQYQEAIIFANGVGEEKLIQRFVEHIIAWGEKTSNEKVIEIYKYDVNMRCWLNTVSKKARPLDSVFLPNIVKNKLVKDLTGFVSDEALHWYHQHGIPYKRIYLFFGTPGAGKTSLIQALAGHFVMNVCFLQPTGPKFTDDLFQDAVQKAPDNSIIVIEDIDSLFEQDRKKKLGEMSPLTFSGLLNALDGIANPDGQVFVLTTNYVDRLDPALIRNGRVDLHIEFPLATLEQMEAMFHSFYPTMEPFGKIFAKDTDNSDSEKKEIDENGEQEQGEMNGVSSSSDSSKNEVKIEEQDPEVRRELDKLAKKFASEWLKRFPKSIPMAAVQQHFITHMRSNGSECVAAVKDEEIYIPKGKTDHSESLYH